MQETDHVSVIAGKYRHTLLLLLWPFCFENSIRYSLGRFLELLRKKETCYIRRSKLTHEGNTLKKYFLFKACSYEIVLASNRKPGIQLAVLPTPQPRIHNSPLITDLSVNICLQVMVCLQAFF